MRSKRTHTLSFKVGFVLLCGSFFIAESARATVLPDACGNDAVIFNVTKDKGALAPAAPSDNKALVVFLQTPEFRKDCIGGCSITTRVGIDGNWVGAVRDLSYFSVAVDPGEHHICANWQSRLRTMSKLVAMSSFTAEAGEIYYFRLEPEDKSRDIPISKGTMPPEELHLGLNALSKDEGSYGIKTSPQSKFTQKSKN